MNDLNVRRLQHLLDAARAVQDTMFDEGYNRGRQHRDLCVPDDFVAALRHGSVHEHVDIAGSDGLVTVVLARAGDGHAHDRREAEIWEQIQRVREHVAIEAQAGVEYMQRQELPRSVAAVIWRWPDDRVAIVTNTLTARPRLRAALRSQRASWILIPVIGWAVIRRLGRGVTHALIPSATIAVVSAAAVTAIATTPPTSITPIEREKGHAIQENRQSPLAFFPPKARSQAPKPAASKSSSAPKVRPTGQPVVSPPPASAAPVPVPTPSTSPAVPTPGPTPTPTPTGQPVPSATPTAISDPGSGVPVTEPSANLVPSVSAASCLLNLFGLCDPN